MAAAADFLREAFRTGETRVDWRAGLAGAIGAVTPLAIGLTIDDPVAGLTAALGVLNTAICVPRGNLGARLWWGSIAVLGGLGAVVVADVAGGAADILFVLLSFGWVGAWAFFRAAGPSGGMAAFAISAVFLVLAGLPATAPLGEGLAWYLLGALLGLTLMAVARAGTEQSGPAGGEALQLVRVALRQDGALRAHALRAAVAVSGASLLYRLLDLPHGYWVPLTTLAVIQPTLHDIHLRGLQRGAGTLGGVALVVLITLATGRPAPLLACAAITAFLLYAIWERGYFWLTLLLTPTVLLMVAAVHFEGDATALDRAADSALGIGIGLGFATLLSVLVKLKDAR
jgi:hypothetical protein